MSSDPARARQHWDRVAVFLEADLWRDAHQGWVRHGVTLLRFAVRVQEGFFRDAVPLRAGALTYFSVLSLVPLLAIISSVVTAVGVTENVVGALIGRVAQVAPEAAERIQNLVANANIAGLGTLGAVALFVTSILGIGNVERALDQIFGAPRHRPLSRRLPDFLAVLLVSPLLLGVGLSLAATAQSQWAVHKLLEYPLFAVAYQLGLGQLPTVLLASAFAFLYWFMPNVRVRPSAAVLGGVLAALGVSAALSLYVGLSVGAARANALYGSFAQLPLFLVWVYFFWIIALCGAECTAAAQSLGAYAGERRSRLAESVPHEALGLRALLEIGRAFRDGSGPCTSAALARALAAPELGVLAVLGALQAARMISRVQQPQLADGFQLGRPAERIRVSDVLAALRGETAEPAADARDPVAALLAELRQGESKALAGRTLADLL